MRVTLGYSPCPNDTFVFCGLVHGHIAGAPVCEEVCWRTSRRSMRWR